MHFFRAFVAVCLLGQASATELSRLLARSSSPPSCSLECMATLVPQFCGSLTNTTCICGDTTLTAALGVCALAACNVTELFAMEKYKADLCGVPNDRTRLNKQLNTYYVLPALASLFVAARIYTRATKDRNVGPDDWMMVAAWVCYLIDVGFGVGMMINKFGLHTYQLTTKQMENNLMFFYICELWYIITITVTKLSLLLFFRRIFPQANFRKITWAVGVYTAVSNFCVLMALTFQCVPFHGSWTNWEYKVYPVKCINTYALVYFAAGNSVIQDFIIVGLPVPILLRLNLAWQKKANLLVMFSVGFFVILCSILRLPSLIKLKTSQDPSWDQSPIAIWTSLEQSVGIICGCLPACRSLAGHLFPFLKMSFTKSSQATPPYHSRRPSKGKLDFSTGFTTGDRSFMELSDHAKNETNTIQTYSFNESKMPINPEATGKYSASIDIHADARAGRGIKSPGIICTKDVDQSSCRN